MVGRFIVEALRRTPVLTRANFMKAIYTTKLFGIDNLLAGPYSNDCVHDPGTAIGKSSLCKCNTGFRFASLTVFNSAMDFVDAGVAPISYPMSECGATEKTVSRPILLSQIYPGIGEPFMKQASDRIGKGIELDASIGGIAKPLFVNDSATNANATAEALAAVSDNHPLLGAVGGMEIAPQEVLPVFPLYGHLHLQNSQFRRETVHLFATIQQEIYVASEFIAKDASKPVHVFLSESAAAMTNDEGTTVRKAIENSFESHDVAGATFSESRYCCTIAVGEWRITVRMGRDGGCSRRWPCARLLSRSRWRT